MSKIESRAEILPEVGEASSRRLAWLFFFAILPFAFDFKAAAAGEGAAVQGLIFAVYIGLLVYFFISNSSSLLNSSSINILIILTLFFQFVGSLVGLLNDQSAYSLFVNNMPSTLYWSAAWLTYNIILSIRDVEFVKKMLKILCYVFLFSGTAYVLISRGEVNFDTSRYEILGSSTVAALGIIPVSIALGMSAFDFAIMVSALAFVLLSVTRSYLVIALAQIAVLGPASVRIFLKPSFLFRGGIGFLALLTVLGLDVLLNIGLFERWIQRMFVPQGHGYDPTYLTRITEVEFMRDKWLESTSQILFGNGLAAQTGTVGTGVSIVAQLVGRASAMVSSMGFGHHNHWSVLYIAGAVGGGPLLLYQFLNVWWSVTFLTAKRFRSAQENAIDYLGLWGGGIVLGTVAYGFLAAPMGNRPIALWYGIGTGMLLAARSRAPVRTEVPKSMPPRRARLSARRPA